MRTQKVSSVPLLHNIILLQIFFLGSAQGDLMFAGYPTMMFQEIPNPGVRTDPNYPATMIRHQQLSPDHQEPMS